ncbi:MAG TPA: hypothetical protein VFE33_22750 [Thermoanaerobaculia bacterium]|nr:hypothetical protein [Thermoanaerobaculia bacterium]
MDGLSPHRRLVAAFLALGLWTLAASPARAAKLPVRLLAPGEGTVLAAGSTATLEWAPLEGAERPGAWEEWEAFLSLDGGATYPVRITPHLDRDLRHVTWKVPSFPTRQGRLLLRFGDERREVACELPQRFAITAAPAGPGALDLPRAALRRGEPARPGEPGVLAWVEGSRRGGQRREVVAAEPARAVPGFAFPASRPVLAAVAAAAPPSGAPAADPGIRSALPSSRAAVMGVARSPRPAATDLLVLLKRRNE